MSETVLKHCDFEDEDCCEICRAHNTDVYYKSVPGTKYCPRHGGCSSAESKKLQQANIYRAEVWQERLRRLGNVDGIKSLRDEVAVLRMILESYLMKAQDDDALLMFSTRISNLASEIGKLLLSCDRLERSMGQHMDKPTSIKFAATLIEIVTRYVSDPETLDNISADILQEMQ